MATVFNIKQGRFVDEESLSPAVVHKGDPGDRGVDGVGISDIIQDGNMITVILTNGVQKSFYIEAVKGDPGESIKGDPGDPGKNAEVDYKQIEQMINSAVSLLPKPKDGEDGAPGEPANQIEMRANRTHVQWRYEGEEWRDLFAIPRARRGGGSGAALHELDNYYTKAEIDALLAGVVSFGDPT